jgi:hypothetical protein
MQSRDDGSVSLEIQKDPNSTEQIDISEADLKALQGAAS